MARLIGWHASHLKVGSPARISVMHPGVLFAKLSYSDKETGDVIRTVVQTQ
jgi:hypothetical protein